MVGLSGSQHELANEYRYSPWGERESAREDVGNALQFQARHYDPASQLYAWRARWYDPSLARFISEDPIGLEGGINLRLCGEQPGQLHRSLRAAAREPVPDRADPGSPERWQLLLLEHLRRGWVVDPRLGKRELLVTAHSKVPFVAG